MKIVIGIFVGFFLCIGTILLVSHEQCPWLLGLFLEGNVVGAVCETTPTAYGSYTFTLPFISTL